jgi:hypothetical protein
MEFSGWVFRGEGAWGGNAPRLRFSVCALDYSVVVAVKKVFWLVLIARQQGVLSVSGNLCLSTCLCKSSARGHQPPVTTVKDDR